VPTGTSIFKHFGKQIQSFRVVDKIEKKFHNIQDLELLSLGQVMYYHVFVEIHSIFFVLMCF
jgi:hypothetical protein